MYSVILHNDIQHIWRWEVDLELDCALDRRLIGAVLGFPLLDA